MVMREKYIIYGAGKTGKTLLKHLKENGIDVICFIDRNHPGHLDGKTVYDLKSIPLSLLQEHVILALHNDVLGAARSLKELGFSFLHTLAGVNLLLEADGKDIFRYNHTPLDSAKLIANRDIYSLKSLLEDDISRDIVENYCSYIRTGRIEFLRKHDSGPMYFSDNRPYECSSPLFYVDCGAYTGDTIEIFNKNLKLDTVVAFEPDPDNFMILRKNLRKMLSPDTKVFTLESGVGVKNSIVSFSQAQDGSAISETGTAKVAITTLDKLLINQPVNFIKMDIEGSEKDALMGAREVITQYAPLLAISAYHSLSDFFEVPQLIHKLNPNYKLYLRSHNDSFHDTVCYAVPERFMRKHQTRTFRTP